MWNSSLFERVRFLLTFPKLLSWCASGGLMISTYLLFATFLVGIYDVDPWGGLLAFLALMAMQRYAWLQSWSATESTQFGYDAARSCIVRTQEVLQRAHVASPAA